MFSPDNENKQLKTEKKTKKKSVTPPKTVLSPANEKHRLQTEMKKWKTAKRLMLISRLAPPLTKPRPPNLVHTRSDWDGRRAAGPRVKGVAKFGGRGLVRGGGQPTNHHQRG